MSDFIVNPPNNSCEAATPNAGASVTSLVTYDGTDLACIGFTSGDNLNTALSSMNSAICALTDTISLYNTNIRSYQQQISQISNTVNNLSCSDIRTTDLSWACIVPSGDTLCGVLTAMEAKICDNASNVMSASEECAVEALAILSGRERQKYVMADGIGLQGFTQGVHSAGTFQTGDGIAVDDDGCTETITATATPIFPTKSNWIRTRKGSGIIVESTALAAAEPALADNEVSLYKVDTDGANSIVTIIDQRKHKPYNESFFEASTDMSAFLGVGGVNSDKLNLDTKLTYNAAYTFTADEDIVSKKYVDDSLASSVPVVLWNTSGATTYYDAGAVGIGTSTPDVTQSAHIVGSLRYEDTNEAVGKFLTCDATGIATWASLPVLASTIEGRDEGSVINNFTAINFLGAGVTSVDGGGGVFDVTITGSVAGFTDLSDTAVTYVGSGDFFLRVNTGENSVDFVDGSTINISTFNNDSGFITSYTEIDDLENVLSRDNSTGAYDISISSGQSIKYNNSGFTATISESTLTGNIVLSLPAASGTLASLSDIPTELNGMFDASNDGGTIPTSFDADLTDTLNIGANTLVIDKTNGVVGVGSADPYNAPPIYGGNATYHPVLIAVTASLQYGYTHTDGTIELGTYVDSTSGGAQVGAGQGTMSVHDYQLMTSDFYRLRITTGGDVAIGTEAQTLGFNAAKFGVYGSIQMIDGNEAVGYVMTSDANGVASWAAAGGGVGDVLAGTYTNDYITKWNATANTIESSSIRDNGNIGINFAPATTQKLGILTGVGNTAAIAATANTSSTNPVKAVKGLYSNAAGNPTGIAIGVQGSCGVDINSGSFQGLSLGAGDAVGLAGNAGTTAGIAIGVGSIVEDVGTGDQYMFYGESSSNNVQTVYGIGLDYDTSVNPTQNLGSINGAQAGFYADTEFVTINSSGVFNFSNIDDLTEDLTPDLGADFVMTWDKNLGIHKKVKLETIAKQGFTGTGAYTNFTIVDGLIAAAS